MMDLVEMSPVDHRLLADFRLLVEYFQDRSLGFVRVEDLPMRSIEDKGVSFRYDIHARDIQNAYFFIQEHARKGIPGVFFLQIDYSLAERKRGAEFVDLANFALSKGLEVGLHTSPVDSYFIWAKHGGNAREYASWLREQGVQFVSTLASDPKLLASLHCEVSKFFEEFVEKSRSVLGDFALVASHGGELRQLLRPKIDNMDPATLEIYNSLCAEGWMRQERLADVGVKGDVEQFKSIRLRQATDGGGGYKRMQESLLNISPDISAQVLIHPYGWGGSGSSVLLPKEAQKSIETPRESFSVFPCSASSLPPETPSSMTLPSSVDVQFPVGAGTPPKPMQFSVLDFAKPEQECKPLCSGVYEKWEGWFLRTFKNIEQEIDGVRYSLPSIPLAVIETLQTEVEYLKLIGDKSRNMLRKAAKNGYTVRSFNSVNFIDDIHAIRTSKDIRSGKPVPASFKERPKPFDTGNERRCCRHQVVAIGVFSTEGALVSYAALHNCGDLAIINTIMGHGDHLKFGIMNLLVFGVFKEIKERFSGVKYINYLTLRSSTSRLDTFKKSVGFVSRDLCLPITGSSKEQKDGCEIGGGRGSNTLAEDLLQVPTAPAILSQNGSSNPLADMVSRKSFRKILIRGDCCSIRTVARNPELFGKPEIVQNEKCTMQVYLDHLQGISYPDDALASISDLEAMPPSLHRYYVNQNKASILSEIGADLLVIDSYADSFFQLYENKKTKAKLWVNAKFLRDRTVFEREHTKLPRKTFHEVLVDTQKFIEHVRSNNPNLPVLYLTHPIHFYRYLNSRREFCYLGEELERFMPNVYWGTHLPKEACEPVDMNSCGPGETHHYTPETYAKMVLAAAARSPFRTTAEMAW